MTSFGDLWVAGGTPADSTCPPSVPGPSVGGGIESPSSFLEKNKVQKVEIVFVTKKLHL